MKQILFTVLIVGCLFQASFAQVDEINEKAYQELKKLNANKFGKTILDTVAVQIKAGDPATDLIKLLQDIEDDLRDEQDKDDEYIQKLQEECDQNLAKLQSEIEKAKARSAELGAELEEKIPLRDQKLEQLARKQEIKGMLEAKIVQLDQRKVLKDQEWAEEQQQHDAASSVLEKVKETIKSQMQSFLQKGSNVFAEVASTVRSNMKSQNFTRKSWNSFLSMVATVADDIGPQADQEGVQKIIDLCENILDKIAESREIERKDYQHWMDEYNTTKDALNDKLDTVNAKITQLEQEIAALNKRIAEAQYEKAEQDKRATDKQTQHDEKLQYCDDEGKAYFERRQARDDERDIVSQTIGLLQANLRTFRKYISDRSEGTA